MQNVIQKYVSGFYASYTLPSLKAILPNSNLNLLYGNSEDDKVFVHNIERCRRFVYTTNCDVYSASMANKDFALLPPVGRCNWCYTNVNETMYDKDSGPLGIPLYYEKHNKTYFFYVEGIYCSFECCLADIYRSTPPYLTGERGKYRDSAALLRMMFDLVYPETNSEGNEVSNGVPNGVPNGGTDVIKKQKKRFFRAPDWRLLEDNGGSMRPEEFHSGSHVYKRLTHYIIPVKGCYERVTN